MTTTVVTELRNGSWEVVAERTTSSFAVRKLGLIRVRGTIPVDEGMVTVEDGQPVAARATLDASSVSTGIRKRDVDLAGRRFFATARHPSIHVVVDDVRPDADADGWTAAATLTVAGGDAPLELSVRRKTDPGAGTIRVLATGVLDLSRTPIRAPRWLIGRWVTVEVDATLRPGSANRGR
ncbi:MAG: YceI family protein [Actinomycetes bacterium]